MSARAEKKSYSEMTVIREIEKAVLTGLKKEGVPAGGEGLRAVPAGGLGRK